MRFNVLASNIHTGESQDYGPFEGNPKLTYENLEAWTSERGPEFLFAFFDPQDTGGEQNPHDYPTWIDQEGATRFDGWRRLLTVPSDETRQRALGVNHTEPDGPFWTDLYLEPIFEQNEDIGILGIYGRCDECGSPCNNQGCTENYNHRTAIDEPEPGDYITGDGSLIHTAND